LRLLKTLLLNRFVFSIIILVLFSFDFKLITLDPLRFYSLEQPTGVPTEYYEIEFGAPTLYIKIYYENDKIHLVPTDNIDGLNLTEVNPVLAWYYYAGLLVLVNIFPFSLINKSKQKKKKKDK